MSRFRMPCGCYSDGITILWCAKHGAVNQLVKVLKRSRRVLMNVYREHPKEFVSGVYDDPGDDELGEKQVEADLFLDEIIAALKVTGEKLPYPDGIPYPECGWLSGHHNVGCKAAGEKA